jgi:2'-5' RNA ligase
MLRTGRLGPARLVRTFVAVEMPEVLRRSLRAAAGELAERLPGVRWTAEENIHLTLKFLGDVPWNETGRIGAAIKEETAAREPFELEIRGIIAFPPGRSPRIVAVGVRADGALQELHDALERRMEEFGVRPETRTFTPHLTLGRIKAGGAPGLADAIAPLRDRIFGNFEVSEIAFFQSELAPEGPTYTCLCRAALLGEPAMGREDAGGEEGADEEAGEA